MHTLWATEIRINRRTGTAVISTVDYGAPGEPKSEITVQIRCPKSASNKELVRRALMAATGQDPHLALVAGPFLKYSWSYDD